VRRCPTTRKAPTPRQMGEELTYGSTPHLRLTVAVLSGAGAGRRRSRRTARVSGANIPEGAVADANHC
jgi:hypothetical protein